MATQTRTEAGDGGGGTTERPSELPVSGACLKTGGYREEKLGALEEVRQTKRLLRERATAPETEEPGHDAAPRGGIRAVSATAEDSGSGAMVGTVPSRAEPGSEVLQSRDGGARPVHARTGTKNRAEGGISGKGRKGAVLGT